WPWKPGKEPKAPVCPVVFHQLSPPARPPVPKARPRSQLMVTGWPPGSGGWPRNAPAARPMALIAEVAGRQVIEERIETGRSQGRAPSGINPVVGFPTAGHLLGRAAHARCWLVAARAPQRPAETLLRYWHGLGVSWFSSRRAFPAVAQLGRAGPDPQARRWQCGTVALPSPPLSCSAYPPDGCEWPGGSRWPALERSGHGLGGDGPGGQHHGKARDDLQVG